MKFFAVVLALAAAAMAGSVREKRGVLSGLHAPVAYSSYVEPSYSGLAGPAVSYVAPAISYAAPAVGYVAPAVSYVGPPARLVSVRRLVHLDKVVSVPTVVHVRRVVSVPAVVKEHKLVSAASYGPSYAAGFL